MIKHEIGKAYRWHTYIITNVNCRNWTHLNVISCNGIINEWKSLFKLQNE